MRVHVGIWMLLVTADMAAAAPVPPPPDNFASLQYIDSAGCVFERDGGDWIPRLDRDGAPVCGFPPSLAARRTDPGAERLLPLGKPPVPPTPGELLMQQLASGLQQGEFIADPLPPETRRAPTPPSRPAPLQVELDEVLGRSAALRATLTGAGRSATDLCELLGYQPDPDSGPILGADVTQGLCPGMRAPVPEVRIQEGGRPTIVAARQPSALPPATPSTTAPAPRPAADARTIAPPVAATSGSGGAGRAVVADRRPAESATSVAASSAVRAKAATAPVTVEMIPASARYVQVGSFTDDNNATLTIRRLSQMGFRVGQTHARKDDQPVRVIMAGPFPNRQALVAALNHLRGNGYPKAVAR